MISPKTWNFIRLIIFLTVIFSIVGSVIFFKLPENSVFIIVPVVFILFAVIMNTIKKNKTPESAQPAQQIQPLQPAQSSPTPQVQTTQTEVKSESGNKIRCRFCGKSYSSEYNGCPHCKKK